MHQKRFHHEVVMPVNNLISRASENVCVEPDFNDVISLAKQAATAAYHFREPILREVGADKVGPMKDEAAEALRQRLRDAVDSAKHGKLRDTDRSTTFRASLAFEYDPSLGFKFIRTEVWATNKRFGAFELSDVILEFIPLLGNEVGVRRYTEQIERPFHPFRELAETYVTSKSGFELTSVGIRTYQRNANGVYKPVDPPEVKFRVLKK
ncbi:hypothetical protein [Tritonibacter mobilis]|uniref:hypothetical protein n=1 Tax=Tritonibacter mobilis TaxID=379347 RepID=UPI00126621F1|nr:hypothetical protein [Tritonibacter mobilis]